MTRWRRKPILKTLFARQGQFTDIHNGFHLRGLQAGDEGLNGQAFVAEGEKGGVHGLTKPYAEQATIFRCIGQSCWRHVVIQIKTFNGFFKGVVFVHRHDVLKTELL